MEQHLPSSFWSSVNGTLEIWFTYLSHVEGPKFQKQIEELLLLARAKKIDDINRLLAKSPKNQLSKIARAVSLGLEWINCCETAHRSVRNRAHQKPLNPRDVKRTTFVLTAHPTESRSPEMIGIVDRLVQTLSNRLVSGALPEAEDLEPLFAVAWKVPFSKQSKPTVQDEATHIFSLLLREPILTLLTERDFASLVHVRTWVGGDKDGHPGVTAVAMRSVLSLSRKGFLVEVTRLLDVLAEDLRALKSSAIFGVNLSSVEKNFSKLKKNLAAITKLTDQDGARVRRFADSLKPLADDVRELLGTRHPSLDRLERLLNLFPALVVPLELREDSQELEMTLKSGKGEISNMLKALSRISKGYSPIHYARGFIVSMTRNEQDLLNAAALQRKVFASLPLPVVPLFENADALKNAAQIVSAVLKDSEFRRELATTWDKYFEVMLGYSDSAKESGALYSRRNIQKAMHEVEQTIRAEGFRPVFFHGSGGSVARGGGSLEEQTAWWHDPGRNDSSKLRDS
jgi:phosphoenolpyruvate carboxylase